MWTVILTVLAALSASLHLRAEYLGPQYQVYLFKPLTMVSIILIAACAREPVATHYKVLVIAGLIFSLAGDVFLMLPTDRFVAGLASFLVAHLLYIAAFRSSTTPGFSPWALVPFIIYGVVVFSILAPYLGQMKLPVLAYVVVILVMAWQGWERWAHTGQPGALWAFIGAALFVVSDSALAINRFRAPYGAAQALVLSTYFAAQWFIARSVDQGQALLFPLSLQGQ